MSGDSFHRRRMGQGLGSSWVPKKVCAHQITHILGPELADLEGLLLPLTGVYLSPGHLPEQLWWAAPFVFISLFQRTDPFAQWPLRPSESPKLSSSECALPTPPYTVYFLIMSLRHPCSSGWPRTGSPASASCVLAS